MKMCNNLLNPRTPSLNSVKNVHSSCIDVGFIKNTSYKQKSRSYNTKVNNR